MQYWMNLPLWEMYEVEVIRKNPPIIKKYYCLLVSLTNGSQCHALHAEAAMLQLVSRK